MITTSDIRHSRILIVDDQEANVVLLEEMLREAGYVAVSSTTNPREVCELHRRNRYSLIVLDLQMPELDGYQLMENLKAVEEESYLSILVQTAQSDHKLRALKAGAKDFVSKPFDLAEVLVRVHNLLEVRLLHEQLREKVKHRTCELDTSIFELREERANLERRVRERTAELSSAKERAESADRLKSQFLANMSHELRTPLNAIIGFSEVLADRTFGPLNDRQGKYINNVLSSGRHLLKLINDVLDLAKLEAGRMELTSTAFSVEKALAEVQAIVTTLADKKKISLEFKVAPRLPLLFAEEAKFNQVMYNLLSNAIKFTADGGRVLVTAGIHQSEGDEADPARQTLRVAVADSGIGIAAKDHERIFKEFEQTDATYVRQQQGTGLGLALTKGLIEMHGGRLWVESEGVEGRGSTFTFLIPFSRIEAKTQPHDHGNAANLMEMNAPRMGQPALAPA